MYRERRSFRDGSNASDTTSLLLYAEKNCFVDVTQAITLVPVLKWQFDSHDTYNMCIFTTRTVDAYSK